MQEYMEENLRNAAWAEQDAQEQAVLARKEALEAAVRRKEEMRLKKAEEKRKRDENTIKGTGVWSKYEYVSTEEWDRRIKENTIVATGSKRGARLRTEQEEAKRVKQEEEMKKQREERRKRAAELKLRKEEKLWMAGNSEDRHGSTEDSPIAGPSKYQDNQVKSESVFQDKIAGSAKSSEAIRHDEPTDHAGDELHHNDKEATHKAKDAKRKDKTAVRNKKGKELEDPSGTREEEEDEEASMEVQRMIELSTSSSSATSPEKVDAEAASASRTVTIVAPVRPPSPQSSLDNKKEVFAHLGPDKHQQRTAKLKETALPVLSPVKRVYDSERKDRTAPSPPSSRKSHGIEPSIVIEIDDSDEDDGEENGIEFLHMTGTCKPPSISGWTPGLSPSKPFQGPFRLFGSTKGKEKDVASVDSVSDEIKDGSICSSGSHSSPVNGREPNEAVSGWGRPSDLKSSHSKDTEKGQSKVADIDLDRKNLSQKEDETKKRKRLSEEADVRFRPLARLTVLIADETKEVGLLSTPAFSPCGRRFWYNGQTCYGVSTAFLTSAW